VTGFSRAGFSQRTQRKPALFLLNQLNFLNQLNTLFPNNNLPCHNLFLIQCHLQKIHSIIQAIAVELDLAAIVVMVFFYQFALDVINFEGNVMEGWVGRGCRLDRSWVQGR
jgi:hypothetical protein